MTTKLITIAAYPNLIEANLAKNRLEEAGLQVILADEETVGTAWYLGNALGGVKLQVNEPDATAALELLNEDVPADAPADAHDEADADVGEHLTQREQNADRAHRGAVLGVLFWPFQFYVFWLLLKVFVSTEELRPPRRQRAWVAAIINLPFMVLVTVLFWLLIS